ncbi:MAG TPA: periplasmic heavy metal sensor [Stellaceae bacterium]|nr:periplasmic heavy metal sensor [Stellaceae bacterium]
MSATIAEIRRDRGVLRHRLLIAILAISLALNICVIAGAAWHRLHGPPTQTFSERLHRLADTLDLTPQQQAAFDRYIASSAARGDRMRKEIEPIIDSAWTEMAKPDADETKVLQLLDQAGDHRRVFMHEAVDETAGLLATLSPDQRARFIAAQREYFMAQRRRRAEESR